MENISFIVQGPVIQNSNAEEGIFSTAEVLVSIRTYYPDAEIVLSTWKGSDTNGLDYDQLVLSEDPGAIIIPGVAPFNINRLIISTINGIKKATYNTIVKTRTDVVFTNNNILNLLQYISPAKGKYSLFSHYILTTNYYVRNPFRLHLLFHSSDIILIGKKADLEQYFNAPIVHRDEFVINDKLIKMVAEQYLIVNSIQQAKNEAYQLNGLNSTNIKYFIKSEKYLFNSFNFIGLEKLGVNFPKKLLFAFRPDANYSIFETDILSTRYRKSNNVDAYSYLRALKYTYMRSKEFIKVKLLSRY